MVLTDFLARAAVAASISAAMTACGGGGGGAADTSELAQNEAAATQASANSAPLISGLPSPTALENTFYEFTPTASDPDGDPIDFGIDGQPPWADFDSANGRLFGTPGAEDVGLHSGIVISASDGKAESPLPAMAIDVMPQPEPENRAPEISGIPPAGVTVGESYDFIPEAFDVDGDSLSFTIENQPLWAVFDPGSGRLSGTPTAADIGEHTDIRISVSDGAATASLDPIGIIVNPPPIIEVIAPNIPPVISGIPTLKVVKGEIYSFVPDASDADGDALTFSITALPDWATFGTATGALSGSPAASDAGIYENIVISVTDGEAAASLGPFAIHVLQVGPRSAELSWIAPTENSDGSPLTDLAGYVVYWGSTKGNHSTAVTLENPGLTTYVVDNLAPGQTYYFVVTAYNDAGLESDSSNEASKSIADDGQP